MLLFGHIGITLGVVWLTETWLTEKFKVRVDYSLIFIGSLLPDIIDKPVGMILLPLNNGRVFGHTLLFILIFLLIGLKYRKSSLALAFTSFLHLLQDEMWNEPETFLWPLLGFELPAKEHSSFYEYIKRIISEYTPSLSHIFISEVIGFTIILAFLMRRRGHYRNILNNILRKI
jgi:hypothetical protein